MKVGEEFDLNIEGHKVGRAKIVAVNPDNTVEMKFEGGRATFQTKTYIEQAPVPSQGQEHALLGVEPREPEDETTSTPEDAQETPSEPNEKESTDTTQVQNEAVTPEISQEPSASQTESSTDAPQS